MKNNDDDKYYEDARERIDTSITLKQWCEELEKENERLSDELEELRKPKVVKLYGYDVDYLVGVVQGLQSKEITNKDLQDKVNMYKRGYENGIEATKQSLKDIMKDLNKEVE